MIKIGAHVSFTKKNNYFDGAVESSLSYRANTYMIFIGPPQSSWRVSFDKFDLNANKWNHLNNQIPFQDTVVHGPYIINPANPQNRDFAIELLTKDALLAEKAQMGHLVVHPGSNTKKLPLSEALKSCAIVIKEVINRTKNIKIAIENMASKGTQIGSSFEELSEILKYINSPRASVCLDTAHAWDAGYNLREFNQILQQFDKIIGIKNLSVIHLNDSKNPLGAKKDRHANIGEGYIGLQTLQNVIHHSRLSDKIFILETPVTDNKPIYKKEIEILLNKGE